jgi:hypothetical protein
VYEEELACDIYHTSRDSELILYYLLPLVGKACRSYIWDVVMPADRDEILGNCINHVFYALVRRAYRGPRNPDDFTRMWFSVVKYEVVRNFEFLTWNQRLEIPPDFPVDSFPQSSRVIHPNDVLNHLYLQQLPSHVLFLVENEVRFEGAEEKACRYIAKQLITGQEIVRAYLSRDFRIPRGRIDFFVDYVQYLIRKILFEIGEEGHPYFTSKNDYRYGSEYSVIQELQGT